MLGSRFAGRGALLTIPSATAASLALALAGTTSWWLFALVTGAVALVGAFLAITFLQSWRKASNRPAEADDLLEGTGDGTATITEDDLERDLENGPG